MVIKYDQIEFSVNLKNGIYYLDDPKQYSPKWTTFSLTEGGVEKISENHWRAIDFLRDYYTKNKKFPMKKVVAKAAGIDFLLLAKLFPWGICNAAGFPYGSHCL